MAWLTALIKAVLEWLTAEVKKDTKASDADAIPEATKRSWADRIKEQQDKMAEEREANTPNDCPAQYANGICDDPDCYCKKG